MVYRPYKLLNATELSVIERKVETLWNSWTSAWITEDFSCQIRCHRAAESQMDSVLDESLWMCVGIDSEQWVALAYSQAFHKRFGTTLLSSEHGNGIVEKSSLLLDDLLNCVLTDLLQLFSFCNTSDNTAELQGTQAPARKFWESGSGTVVAEIIRGDDKLALVLSPQWAMSILDGTHPNVIRKTPLTQSSDALESGRVKLKVVAGEAQLELALLQTIVVGDVIKLNTKIDEPLQVVNDEGIRFCSAFLGSRDGRKSIQLTK